MPFIFTKTEIPEVILVEAKVFPDSRGFFSEVYKASEFKANGIDYEFVQDNAPVSHKGVIRGLHYQLPPYTQGKLVGAVTGKIWDVAVDMRKSSPTFGKWVAEELSEENHRMLFIPPGFAHGFVALEEGTHVLYKMTSAEYNPSADSGVRYNDPDLSIPWPVENPIVSEKDMNLPLFNDAKYFD